MMFNEMGIIVYNEIINIPNYREYVEIDEFVVMPNHVHLIIVIHGDVGIPNKNIGIFDRDVLTKRLYDVSTNNIMDIENNKHFSQISPKTNSL